MVKSYPNIKLWVMLQLKDLKGKQLAFRKGDKKGLKAAHREINKKIREEKRCYRDKLENNFTRKQCQAVLERGSRRSQATNNRRDQCKLLTKQS